MLEILMNLYFIVPLILLVITVLLIISGTNKLKQYGECTGTIVGIFENTSGPFVDAGEKRVSPIVSYSVNGQNYEFIGNYYSTNMVVGQEVKVLYNKDNHAKASIKTGIFFAPIITGALTIVFIIPIIIFVVLKSKNMINF